MDFLNHFIVLNVRDLRYPILGITPYYPPIYLFHNIFIISMMNYIHELITTVNSSHQ
jgi:hypothetical protein